jgi:Family of unknown function (DUF6496)
MPQLALTGLCFATFLTAESAATKARPGKLDGFKGEGMAKYGKKAQSKVERAMHERKHGTLKSGRSGKKVTSRKQAIAIGLSEARKAGAKVPRKRKGGSRKK